TDMRFRIRWQWLFVSITASMILVIAIIGGLSLYRHVNFFERLLLTLNYLTSAQTYGLKYLGEGRSNAFPVHYYVFPVLVCILLVTVTVMFGKRKLMTRTRFAWSGIVFLALFYLFNFNRGLIRHSMGEGTDGFVSSVLYIL